MSEYPKSETSNILYPLDSKNWFGSTIDAVYLFFFLSTITSGSQLEFFQLLFYKAIS
jgi:hypothetical protein